MESELVSLLVGAPSVHIAVLDPLGTGKTSVLRNITNDLRVCDYFGGRRLFLSCSDLSTSNAIWSRLAAVLGLELPCSDDGDDDITVAVVLDELAAHKNNTLVILDKLDSIYSAENAIQQDETDVILAVLAAIDDVTLLVSFCGSSLPESVHWTTTENCIPPTHPDNASGSLSGQKPTLSPLHAIPPPARCDIVSVKSSIARIKQDELPTDTSSQALDSEDTLPRTTSEVASDQNRSEDVRQEQELTRSQPKHRPVFHFRHLPARPTVFHGRDKEIERLVTQVTVPIPAPLGIVGSGGIGKTTLALKVLHHQRVRAHFGPQRFFVSCEGAISPDDVLGQLAFKLGIQLGTGTPIWPAIMHKLGETRQTLLVLDNFESIWSPTDDTLREASEVFLAQLAVIDELTIIVTTRGNLLPEAFTWSNIDTAELETLSSTAARQTFEDLTTLKPSLLAAEPENSALIELLKEVEFVPLAVTLLARLDDLPSRLLREWQEYFTEVLEADQHDGTRRELSVEVSIKISLAHLPPESDNLRPRQLLSVCGRLPAGVFVDVLNYLRFHIPNIDAAAQILLRHSLVYAGNLRELRMLSPVRHHVSLNLPMSDMTHSAVQNFYLSLWLMIPLPEHWPIHGPAVDREITNAFAILTPMASKPTPLLVAAVCQLSKFCGRRGNRHGATAFVENLLPHVEKHLSWKSECLHVLGELLWTRNEERAVDRFRAIAELHAENGMNQNGALAQLQLWLVNQKQIGKLPITPAMKQLFSNFGMSQLGVICEFDRATMLPVAPEQQIRDIREDFLQTGRFSQAALVSWLLGKIKYHSGDSAAAIQEYVIAHALAEQAAPQFGMPGMIKLDIAEMYLERGADCVAVEDLLGEAYAEFTFNGSKMMLLETLRLTSFLRLRQQNMREAADSLSATAKLFRELGFTTQADKFDGLATEAGFHSQPTPPESASKPC